MSYERYGPQEGEPEPLPIWRERLAQYWKLGRGDRPIGWLLLLWPTWWGLWLAAEGCRRCGRCSCSVRGLADPFGRLRDQRLRRPLAGSAGRTHQGAPVGDRRGVRARKRCCCSPR
jgi:hypothetical protein